MVTRLSCILVVLASMLLSASSATASNTKACPAQNRCAMSETVSPNPVGGVKLEPPTASHYIGTALDGWLTGSGWLQSILRCTGTICCGVALRRIEEYFPQAGTWTVTIRLHPTAKRRLQKLKKVTLTIRGMAAPPGGKKDELEEVTRTITIRK